MRDFRHAAMEGVQRAATRERTLPLTAADLQALPREEQIARIASLPEAQQEPLINATFSPLLRMGVKAEIAKKAKAGSPPTAAVAMGRRPSTGRAAMAALDDEYAETKRRAAERKQKADARITPGHTPSHTPGASPRG